MSETLFTASSIFLIFERLVTEIVKVHVRLDPISIFPICTPEIFKTNETSTEHSHRILKIYIRLDPIFISHKRVGVPRDALYF